MRISLPTLAAIIGLLGIIAGSFIQAVVARANRRHERLLALEIKRTEERIVVYMNLIKYVLQAERVAGRTMGPFTRIHLHSDSPSAVGDEVDFGQNNSMSDEMAARLMTFSSIYLRLLFTEWTICYFQTIRARELKGIISLVSPPRDGYRRIEDAEDELDLDRAGRIANERAAEFAQKLVRQVQAELAGESSFVKASRYFSSFYCVSRKIPRYFQDRRERQRMGLEKEFMEDAINRISAKLSAATAAARPTGASIAQAEQQPHENGS
jgi:hypothetical protein